MAIGRIAAQARASHAIALALGELPRFKVPRAKRVGGYRSKAPAVDGVSSWTFTHKDLRELVAYAEVDVEERGFTRRSRPGDIARSLLGARFR